MKMLVLMVITGMVVASAGCFEQMGGGKKEMPEDYSKSYEDYVTPPEHSKSYTFPVEEGAVSATVKCDLGMEAGGAPFPGIAYITVTVKDPGGTEIGDATLYPVQSPSATIKITSFKSYGSYKVDITGYGLSGGGYGAKYTLKIDVDYPE